jgi:raffinose/stachyose/melibiose transport system permease protein
LHREVSDVRLATMIRGLKSDRVATYGLLIAFSIISGYPLLWLIFGSFKNRGELFTNLWLWPSRPTLDNYGAAWNVVGIGAATINSLIVTASCVLCVVLIGSVTGYTLARRAIPGKRLLLAAILLTLVIRPSFAAVQLFEVVKALGIINTYLALILPYTATSLPLAIALFTAFFIAIPLEIEEAARIDGASTLTVFLRIVIPLSAPVLSAVVIFTFLDAYNELFMALILLNAPALKTLPPTLAGVLGQYDKSFPTLFAGLAASTLPVLVVFLAFRRRFISGVMSGAVRG